MKLFSVQWRHWRKYPIDGKNYSLSSHYYLSLLRASSLFLYQIYFYFKTTGCSVGIYQPASCPMIAFPLSCFYSGYIRFTDFLTTRLDPIHFVTGVVENGSAPSLANISANLKKILTEPYVTFRGLGEDNSWKNLKQKISCHCPFNCRLAH